MKAAFFICACMCMLVVGLIAGRAITLIQIEATCNDPNSATTIHGVDYVCLPPAAWQELYKRLQGLRA